MEISSVEEMERFISQMDGYINETRTTIRRLVEEHERAGSFWQSKQYDELRSILYDVDRDVKRELQALELLNLWVRKKARILEDIQGKKIRR